jgi:hypothetical protein
MWNGRTELARELVAPRFALHLPLPNAVDPTTVDDPESVERWVVAHRARFERITFHYDAGPFVDTVAGVVAGPWSAEIVVGGVVRRACGMDTIAFRDGKITEYWTLSKEAEDVGGWTTARALGPTSLRRAGAGSGDDRVVVP